MACHYDMAAARNLVRGGLTTVDRFNVMHGRTTGPWSDTAAKVLHKLIGAYDMNKHTRGGSRQAGTVTDDFTDHFAIVGPPETCLERLGALARLGLGKMLSGAALASPPISTRPVP